MNVNLLLEAWARASPDGVYVQRGNLRDCCRFLQSELVANVKQEQNVNESQKDDPTVTANRNEVEQASSSSTGQSAPVKTSQSQNDHQNKQSSSKDSKSESDSKKSKSQSKTAKKKKKTKITSALDLLNLSEDQMCALFFKDLDGGGRPGSQDDTDSSEDVSISSDSESESVEFDSSQGSGIEADSGKGDTKKNDQEIIQETVSKNPFAKPTEKDDDEKKEPKDTNSDENKKPIDSGLKESKADNDATEITKTDEDTEKNKISEPEFVSAESRAQDSTETVTKSSESTTDTVTSAQTAAKTSSTVLESEEAKLNPTDSISKPEDAKLNQNQSSDTDKVAKTKPESDREQSQTKQQSSTQQQPHADSKNSRISFLYFWRAVGSVVLKSLPRKSVSDTYGVGQSLFLELEMFRERLLNPKYAIKNINSEDANGPGSNDNVSVTLSQFSQNSNSNRSAVGCSLSDLKEELDRCCTIATPHTQRYWSECLDGLKALQQVMQDRDKIIKERQSQSGPKRDTCQTSSGSSSDNSGSSAQTSKDKKPASTYQVNFPQRIDTNTSNVGTMSMKESSNSQSDAKSKQSTNTNKNEQESDSDPTFLGPEQLTMLIMA